MSNARSEGNLTHAQGKSFSEMGSFFYFWMAPTFQSFKTLWGLIVYEPEKGAQCPDILISTPHL